MIHKTATIRSIIAKITDAWRTATEQPDACYMPQLRTVSLTPYCAAARSPRSAAVSPPYCVYK